MGRGQRERKVRMAPIGLKPVWLKVDVPRYRCKGCGQTWEVSPPLSRPMPAPWQGICPRRPGQTGTNHKGAASGRRPGEMRSKPPRSAS
ncbi:MAG: transposase family protein [Limisphaerales bacterium]